MPQGYGAFQGSAWAAPAAGADFAAIATVGTQQIQTISASLATSSHAATRYVCIKITDSAGNIYAEIGAGGTQTASLTYQYTWLLGVEQTSSTSAIVVANLPNIWLPAGFKFITVTANIDTNDQWSTGYYGLLQ
jgi:hypothetical protein